MSRTFYLFSIVLLYLLLSCTKDKVPCTTCPSGQGPCQNVQELKDYFYFKPGSWWVYQEVNTSELDTLTVIQSTEDLTSVNFNVLTFSSREQCYIEFWPVITGDCMDKTIICDKCIFVKRSKYKPGNFIGESYCFSFKIDIGDITSDFNPVLPENKIIVDNVFDNFAVSGFQFGKTVKVHELATEVENYQPTNHYFTKDIGLSKKELLDSLQTWELINYFIQP